MRKDDNDERLTVSHLFMPEDMMPALLLIPIARWYDDVFRFYFFIYHSQRQKTDSHTQFYLSYECACDAMIIVIMIIW